MTASKNERSKRTTSKTVLVACFVLTWALMFYAVAYGQAESVAPWAFLFLTSAYGTYVGIGHADYRVFQKMALAKAGVTAAIVPQVVAAVVPPASTEAASTLPEPEVVR
jgi:hypothetical protein